MYEELIERLNPSPVLNLKWYKEKDLYSEGEIEDTIVKIISENEPEDYVQSIAQNYCWSVYYHLTDVRRNILNWYEMKPESSVLEIGCGMGAITSLLCEKCQKVTAVELSKRRAVGTLLRCREKDNLEIIVGNLNDIEFEEKFDYITLIGVLEYQGSYTDSDNPYFDFLKKVKSLLKPSGKLLIAIENQYGLKYWCGAREDHTGLPFEGLNQYSISDKKVRTFSRKGLEQLVRSSGFAHTFFYYPMPDYKLPFVIYSQDYLPSNGNMLNMSYYYVPNGKTLVAQEDKLYDDVIDNGVYEFFANSFLVECSDDSELGCVKFASLSSKRFPEYQTGTKIIDFDKVVKFSLRGQAGEGHLLEIVKNEQEMSARGLDIVASTMRDGRLYTDYIKAKTVEEELLERCHTGGQKAVFELLDWVYDQILLSSETVEWEENILYTFGLDIKPDRDRYGVILKTGYLDMIFRNAFLIADKIQWFDQEWKLENVPAGFIMYRALIEFYNSFRECLKIIPLATLVERYNLLMALKDYQTLESLFIGSVADQFRVEEYRLLCTASEEQCLDAIQRISKI